MTIGALGDDKTAESEPPQAADVLGLSVQTVTPQLAEGLNTRADEGVVDTEVKPGSVADRAGIVAGTVIVQVNREPVADT